ncbi:cytochrome P450 [Corynebacterium guangdongense]|uniref:Cytochrome P450 n=1 Tax=Corynebacterium guangdongense TaxID=1783348 RepID=A0ABU1ZWG3_9CORY|nr:cytochrome P450 [Corynebacterium guangdongense]MDR7328572.1 cytochrome P450 [Corynebacterium guangdongense]WJZ17149.1 Cytochrome P450 107B1 [Corynebacterium guangdongense]
MSAPTSTRVESDVNLFSDQTLNVHDDSVFGPLRESGAVVYLTEHDAYAITRYDEVKEAAGNPEVFSSAQVAFNPKMNEMLKGTSLVADPPNHGPLRAVLSEHLSPRSLRKLKVTIDEKGDALVKELFSRESFDGMKDLAVAFPVSIVLDLIGVQGDIRDKILGWGDAAFNLLGSENERMKAAFPAAGEMFHWTHEVMSGEHLAEGSIGKAVWAAAERGEIAHESFNALVHQILAAGMDTTVTTLGNVLVLFGQHPDQWEKLKADPSLASSALTEVLRLRTPAPVFGRLAREDIEIGGTVIPAGSQVALCYGSANMDPRHYENPETFDITRNAADHVSFGYGIHGCAGQGLARLEINAIINAMLKYVDVYSIGEVKNRLNNFTRPYESVEVKDITLV